MSKQLIEKELRLILQEGEGFRVEFKESFNNIDKDIVALANSSGGKIFLGISDDKRIVGIRITNKLKSQIQDIVSSRPSPKIFFEELKDVLAIEVREGEDKPYECSSGFFKRIGSNSQKLTRNEIIELFKSEGKVRFDELIESKFNYPRDFDRLKFKRFLQMAEISNTKNVEKLLLSLGVAEKQEGKLYFNNAGILFFAKEPQHFIPWSVFTVALFKNEAGTDIIDRKEITGSLFEIVEEVMKFVKLYSKVAYRFTGAPRRENVYEYPFEAIREAVINSVMHKYYFEHGHNNILKFLPNKIRIENYWIKPSKFVLGKTVFRRNQIIADLFSKIHFGEKMGTGFERIAQICRKEKAPFPKIEFNEDYFYTTFAQAKEYLKMQSKEQKTVGKSSQKLYSNYPETIQKILIAVGANSKVTIKELATSVGLSEIGIKYNLSKLKKVDILKRIGPDKGGYWKILKKAKKWKNNMVI